MNRKLIFPAIVALLCVGARAQAPPATQPGVDPVADQILRQYCEFLAKTPAFAVHAEVWKDEVLPSGHKIQVTRTIELAVRRPDRFHIDARAHHKGRAIWYDGKTITVLERLRNLYSTVEAPGNIDDALDTLAMKFGITVPLEDLAVSDPYASCMKNVTTGGFFGEESILGVSCRHIGFSTDRIDWQMWIAQGPQPLPQKIVITYRQEDQSPQFIAILSRWNLMDRASDLAFQFIPPDSSSKIPMVALDGKGRP